MRFIHSLFDFVLRAGHNLCLGGHSVLVICALFAITFVTNCGKDGNSGGGSPSPTPPPSVNHPPQLIAIHWQRLDGATNNVIDWGTEPIPDSGSSPLIVLYLDEYLQFDVEWSDSDGDPCTLNLYIGAGSDPDPPGILLRNGPAGYPYTYYPPASIPSNGSWVFIKLDLTQDDGRGYDEQWLDLLLYNP